MKGFILTFFIALLSVGFCQAQQIEAQKVFGGYKFTQNGKQKSLGDLSKLMKTNSEAYSLISKARTNNTIATLISGAGGALIGFPLGTAMSGGDPNWTVAAVGAGLVAVAIPIASGANKKAIHAVQLYNTSINATTFYQQKPSIRVVTTGNGAGLAVLF